MTEPKFTITALRANLGMTQKELAEVLGITMRQYVYLEKHPLDAKAKYIVKIAELAKVPLDMIDYGCKNSQ